jgi:hypothetical protein
MVLEGEDRAADAVIVIEPIRSSTHTTTEEMRAATKNNETSFREWAGEETAWILGQLAKTAISVAVFRIIHQLFRAKITSESVYRRAADLWGHGQEREGDRANGPRPEWMRSPTGPFAEPPRTSSATGNACADDVASDVPKYVASIEGHHLYLHGRRLHPAQQWPCPILVPTPCRVCAFLEHDGSGTAQCVAVWKMKAVVHGIDGGDSFDEVRDWIRNS